MKLRAECRHYSLRFINPAGTSRGSLTQKTSFFLKLYDTNSPDIFGIGECGLLPGLSLETEETAAKILGKICHQPDHYASDYELLLKPYPSVEFAFETALLDLQGGGKRILFESPFTKGSGHIPFNALVWMAGKETMQQQIDKKLNRHCRCIKIKIGALDFETELNILAYIRRHRYGKQVEIRLDANGAFSPKQALSNIEQLEKFNIHSLEQPIRKHRHQALADIIRQSPIPIALDEELTGTRSHADKENLLIKLKPHYLVLKPGLLGGFRECEAWIALCKKYKIGYWITSALESNIGLNAIAQWTYLNMTNIPQGLGTGKLYANNIPSGITALPDYRVIFDPQNNRRFKSLNQLDGHFKRHGVRKIQNGYEFDAGFQNRPEFWEQIEILSKQKNIPKYFREFSGVVKTWHANRSKFMMQTSGSTGTPKRISISKKFAEISAKHTLSALNIPEGGRLLLCLPVTFIAGVMVYVRAVVANASLTVVIPETDALKRIKKNFDLVSLVPYQLSNVFQFTEQCRCILLGGGKVPEELCRKIKNSPSQVFETYGMTETISHIALKNLTTGQTEFTLFPHVNISTDKAGKIVISSPEIGIEKLIANDVVNITGKRTFEWLGRIDDVINVAGKKIFATAIESVLRQYLFSPFIIIGIPHPTLGQIPALVVEGTNSQLPAIRDILKTMKSVLAEQEIPRCVLFTQAPLFDKKGKIKRRMYSEKPSLFSPID